jgi:hypothetical protein
MSGGNKKMDCSAVIQINESIKFKTAAKTKNGDWISPTAV